MYYQTLSEFEIVYDDTDFYFELAPMFSYVFSQKKRKLNNNDFYYDLHFGR